MMPEDEGEINGWKTPLKSLRSEELKSNLSFLRRQEF